MKKALWVLCFSWMSTVLLAQDEVLVPIVNQKVFNLDSRTSVFFKGNHTSVIEIGLPENTVRWYYRFYNVNKKDLLSQYIPKGSLLEELENDMHHPQVFGISLPSIPKDEQNKVGVYLLKDSTQVSLFNKQLTLQKAEYKKEFSLTNEASGWVEVCDPDYVTGGQYIGLLNRATLGESHVVLDVVAVIKKRSVNFGWSEKHLKKIEEDFVSRNSSDIPIQSLRKATRCLLRTLQYDVSYKEYALLNQQELDSLEKDIVKKCYNEKFVEAPLDTLNQLDRYFVFGSWETVQGEVLEMSFSGDLKLMKKDGKEVTGVWYLSSNKLHLKFDDFDTQIYDPIMITPDKYVWRNSQTENYIRYVRLK